MENRGPARGRWWKEQQGDCVTHAHVSFHDLLGRALCFPPAPSSVSTAGKSQGQELPLLPLWPLSLSQGGWVLQTDVTAHL